MAVFKAIDKLNVEELELYYSGKLMGYRRIPKIPMLSGDSLQINWGLKIEKSNGRVTLIKFTL